MARRSKRSSPTRRTTTSAVSSTDSVESPLRSNHTSGEPVRPADIDTNNQTQPIMQVHDADVNKMPNGQTMKHLPPKNSPPAISLLPNKSLPTSTPSTSNTSSHSNSKSNTLPFSSTSTSSSISRRRGLSFGVDQEETPLPPSIVWSTLCCNAGRGPLSWTGLGIVCSALACGSLGIHLLLDMIGEQLESVNANMYTGLGSLAVLLVMIAVPVTHGLVGKWKNGSFYRFFQPFVGGLRFVLLQVLAWTLWTLTVLSGIYGVWVGGKKLTSGWLSAVGVGGVVSQLLVLVSLHFFVSTGSSHQDDKVAALKAARALTNRERRRKLKAKFKQQQRTRIDEETEVDAIERLSMQPQTISNVMTKLEHAASTSFWPFGASAMKITFFVIATLSVLLAGFIESMPTKQSTTVSIQSMLTSAILLAVPITHLLARRSLTHAGYLLFQPFKGGRKFVTLQAIAWTLWTLAFCSAAFTFVVVTTNTRSTGSEVGDLTVPWPWLSNLITSAGLGGIISQALVLLSLKYFDSKLSHTIGTTARVLELAREAASTPRASSVSSLRKPGETYADAVTESEVYDRAVQILNSPMIKQQQLWTASPSTTRSPSLQRISTPRTGTPTSKPSTPIHDASFPYATTNESITLPLWNPNTTVAPPPSAPSRLDTESPDSDVSVDVEPPRTLARIKLRDLDQSLRLTWHYFRSAQWPELFRELLLDAQALLVVSVLWMVPIVGAFLTFAPWICMYMYWPLPWYFYSLYGTFVLLYLSTYRGRPGITGARSWSAVRDNPILWNSLSRYFNGQVIPLGQISEANGPYIFGFHPHGVYPMTCFWSTRGAEFQKHYPGLQIDVCGASIMFNAPFLREICMWAGGREVSGTAIRTALKAKRSIMLVPGGQREMRHSMADPSYLTLVTRHRGFVRMALEHGTPLVPVLSIGETMLLQNVHAPRIQAYTLKTIGVGFPIWPYGRWYSPLPNPHPVVVVFGHPIQVPLNKEPSNELIDEIHQIYYKQLHDMFMSHRHLIPGFEACQLIYEDE